ncbi:hypothetical protein [Vibrio aestuarianus]|uniref:hypothetical protein n=1 Tax=Vibrio aestuarianus TaxID=28171 RepID=UPI0020B16F72|nr:hypothetical protein [Vibrio aestuarianus]
MQTITYDMVVTMSLWKTSTTAQYFASLLTIPLLSGCIAYSLDEYHSMTYSTLSEAYYSENELTVADNPNVVRSAVEQNHLVWTTDLKSVEDELPTLFPELNLHEQNSHPFDVQIFHVALNHLIGRFGCELYSSVQNEDSVQTCDNQGTIAANNLGYLPFNKGKYLGERLQVHQQSNQQRFAIDLYLKSTFERSLDSVWGAVHTLGHFNHSQLSPDSLVLTVYLNSYTQNSENALWQPLHAEPLIFFVLLPNIDSILSQENEMAASDFSYNNSKLLLVKSQ